MKVLFDESVRNDGILGEYSLADWVWQREKDFKPKTKQHEWKQKEIDCLDAVAVLYWEKLVIPYTTDELYAEYSRGKTFPSRSYKDVFKDINFERVLPLIERSKWGISMNQFIDKRDVIKYCKCFFLNPSAGRIEKFIIGMKENPVKSLSAFEEKCLRKVKTFKEMCHGIDEEHYPDALHLWTAEENGLDVFLTTDKKFRNVMDRQIKLNCQIMFPSE